jgi:intermembrane space import and assembly protein 40
MIEKKRRQAAAAAPPPPPPVAEPIKAVEEKAVDKTADEAKPTETEEVPAGAAGEGPEPGSPEALEHEAAAQGAFNPETGEINWDCPCLGGMANGPCGEEFKAAFSCFVYSTEEPKGMDCIDKFQYVGTGWEGPGMHQLTLFPHRHMQDCFRKYPEIYGSELADDDDEAAPAQEGAEALAKEEDVKGVADAPAPVQKVEEITGIPKEATDATDANEGKKQ